MKRTHEERITYGLCGTNYAFLALFWDKRDSLHEIIWRVPNTIVWC